MRKKRLIVSCLLPAYLLLVLHAVIPHHHHFSAHDGPVSFHHGFNDHHHEHLITDHHDDHGHTAHFVHSPEFGIAMVRPGLEWVESTFPNHVTGIIEATCPEDRNSVRDATADPFPESPPRYVSPAASSASLRGPPSLA